MIVYTDSLEGVTPQGEHPQGLEGFFVGWAKKPSPQKHLAILMGSYHVWLAKEDHKVVGFINAVSDGILSAYIPLLEVLPAYQGQGIGKKLVQQMLETLNDYYMIDLICDPDMQAFYEQVGGKAYTSIIWRNYARQGDV